METGIKEPLSDGPMISVIVPVFNTQDYLEDCLRSILGQTWQRLEILVVDDGSSDRSGEIADRLEKQYPEKIRVFHKENTGVFDTRLYGAGKAGGDWIAFADSDDILEPDMYERLVGNAVKYRADISHCGYQTIVNNGERIHYFYNTGRLCLQDTRQGIDDLMSGEFVEPSVCSKLYRADLFRGVYGSDLLDKTIRYTEDLLLNYILFKGSKLSVYEDFCPYHYMVRPRTASRSGMSPQRILDPVRVCERILKDGGNRSNDVIIRRCLESLLNAFYNSYAYGIGEKDRRALREKLLAFRGKWSLLRRTDRVKLRMLLFSPGLYHVLYRLYGRFLQKKVYE